MMKWQAELKLRLPGKLRKRVYAFTYEWGAWMIAYDRMKLGPSEFAELPIETQINAINYGAAAWGRVKQGKGIDFTLGQITTALMHASRESNLKLSDAMRYAQLPEWLNKEGEEGEKKK